MHEYMELTFLGTGGSWPSAHRNVSAIALKRGSEVLLFDCGEGTQRQFQRSNVSHMAVTRIFITHLHGDHVLGLPGLMQTMGLNDRSEPLEVYGPPGLKRFLRNVTTAPMPRPAFPVRVTELEDGAELVFDGYHVVARRLAHTIPNIGYAVVEDDRPGRFNKARAVELGVPEGRLFGELQRGETVVTPEGRTVTPDEVLGAPRRGRKFVYTGDCQPCEATVELADGADVLVHDATFASDAPQANEFGHSTAQQAAFIAAKANVGTLYLTHISPRYRDAEPLLEEARKVFSDTVVAKDLLTEIVRFPADEVAVEGAAEPATSPETGADDATDEGRASGPADAQAPAEAGVDG